MMGLIFVFLVALVSGQTYTFAAVTFEQSNTPDVYASLPVSTVEDAIIDSLPTDTTAVGSPTAFPLAVDVNYDAQLSIGWQVRKTEKKKKGEKKGKKSPHTWVLT